jgi:hypothetical protein
MAAIRRLIIIVLLLTGNCCLKAQTACPVNFDGKTLSIARKDGKDWYGKIVAFNAMVMEVKDGPHDRPYYRVALEDSGQLWIASLMKSGYEKPGRTLRILGYFSDTEGDEIAAKYNKMKYQVLAFAVVDLSTKQMSIVPEAKLQAQDWIRGKIPEAHK